MKKIIKEEALDRQLQDKGYAVIPLLDGDTVAALKSYYYNKFPQQVDTMYATAHENNIGLRAEVSDHLLKTIQPFIEQKISGITVLGGSYIVKGSNKMATLPPHQDWSLVDENSYRSFNIWIPLVDTSADNGGIQIVPGSHLFGFLYRGPNISSAYEKVVNEIWSNMITLDIPAGHALFYDHRLLHASGVNNTGELRMIAVMGAIESEAQMKIYYKNEDVVEEYDCTPDFFNLENPQSGPGRLRLADQKSWHFPTVTVPQLQALFRQAGLPLTIQEPQAQASAPSFMRRIRNKVLSLIR